MIELPIDAQLPELLKALGISNAAVLTSDPGTGKTTRAPWALTETDWCQNQAVWVLQPRRLAAYVAAARVADERGLKLGKEVGYHFRFEREEEKDTRLLFLTEGMFLRRLQANPFLGGVACVVLDEFHERSLDGDLALALLKRLRVQDRPDLKILVMSATLDADAVGESLGQAPLIHAPGKRYDVEIKYLEKDRSDPAEFVEKKFARALRQVMNREGDILAFMPGTGEIRRCAGRVANDPEFATLEILPLHGQLSSAEQRRALGPFQKRKLIIATSVAETSLTVPGVRVVIDAGLSRRDVSDPYTGLSTLLTTPASKAAMTQRAGRAGREAPGYCLRFGSSAEFQARPDYETPEIARADLASAMLQSLAALAGPSGPAKAAAAGSDAFASLPWFEAPPENAIAGAKKLLLDCGAIDNAARLTPLGKALAKAPMHPRLALALGAAAVGARSSAPRALKAVILLSEERPKDLDFFHWLRIHEMTRDTQRLIDQCAGWLNEVSATWPAQARAQGEGDERLARALLRAFPNLVGFTKKGSDKRGEASFALAAGGEAVVKDEAAHLKPGFYLLLSILSQKHQGSMGLKPKALCLLKLEEGWLLDECPTWLTEENRVAFDAGSKSVKADTRMKFGELVLDEGPAQNTEARAKIANVLWQAARERPLSEFCGEGQPERYLSRRDFAVAGAASPLKAADLPGEEELWALIHEFCGQGAMSFDDLRKLDPLRQVMLKLPAQVAQQFERSAPKSVKLPSGREASIQYERGKPPFVASRLQDFFGLRDTPSINGKPLTLHLLAPNQRPQQVTNDLAGFWEREYPRVRSELGRKYPRHKWPEDPLKPEAKS